MVNRFRKIALSRLVTGIGEGIEFLINNLNFDAHPNWFTDIMHLKSRKSILQKQYNQEVITQDQYISGYNKITKSVINQIDEICQNNPTFKNQNVYFRLIPESGQKVDYPVFLNDELMVGRSVDADIKLETPFVSRNHCKFFISNLIMKVIDLNSTNGTIINGFRIKNSTLKSGDEIQVGNYTIQVLDMMKTLDNEG